MFVNAGSAGFLPLFAAAFAFSSFKKEANSLINASQSV